MNVILLNVTCTNSVPCSNKKFVHAVKSLSLLHLRHGRVQYDEKGNGSLLRKTQSFQLPNEIFITRHSMELSHKMIDHSLLDILENYPKDETKLLDAALKQRQLK